MSRISCTYEHSHYLLLAPWQYFYYLSVPPPRSVKFYMVRQSSMDVSTSTIYQSSMVCQSSTVCQSSMDVSTSMVFSSMSSSRLTSSTHNSVRRKNTIKKRTTKQLSSYVGLVVQGSASIYQRFSKSVLHISQRSRGHFAPVSLSLVVQMSAM